MSKTEDKNRLYRVRYHELERGWGMRSDIELYATEREARARVAFLNNLVSAPDDDSSCWGEYLGREGDEPDRATPAPKKPAAVPKDRNDRRPQRLGKKRKA